MKKILFYILSVFLFISCKKEGSQPVLTGFADAALTATATELKLSKSAKDSVALQLMWDAGKLSASNGYTLEESLLTTTVQYAVDASFSSIKKEVAVTSSSISYTSATLNTLVLGFGLTADESGTLYVRLKSTLAANTSSRYSNVLTLHITPYTAGSDAAYLYMASTDLTSFPWKLCARNKDGKYDGFVKVDQWYNFLLTNEESNSASVIYGGYPANGNQYVLYAGSDRWNCWTANGGYLYITANTNALTWSETVVSSLSVVGDFNSWSTTATPMTYDAARKIWTATITTTAAEQWGIKVLVNQSWSWFFGAGDVAGVTTLYTADASGFPYTKVGTYTLKLDLSDPHQFKYSVE
ncbi:DUF5111 domain-containing protein [Chitinophaga sancti]|uniref:Carbohydrate-binding module 48 (Isoamylase N-terminal domain) n=1 Tax=Chitinophaga sancti TaxID=1004 RepID=A0A1K1STZ6_9BACT|nr:DUF5111 domain-containing protein [Chitinophaga sancti]WQD60827.1 DUF5111 domain-containing protein [Chitinophaga sancti]WQG87045.1 DUF5111 domain-containing protein [Chitinophaga sancti]SFW87708.1 Carbohydrate-binding module 48 (Isoamylase N-terminal domain) [Chitinophaga sancti]